MNDAECVLLRYLPAIHVTAVKQKKSDLYGKKFTQLENKNV